MHVCVCVCMNIPVYVCVHACVCFCVCMCESICVYVCVHRHKSTMHWKTCLERWEGHNACQVLTL